MGHRPPPRRPPPSAFVVAFDCLICLREEPLSLHSSFRSSFFYSTRKGSSGPRPRKGWLRFTFNPVNGRPETADASDRSAGLGPERAADGRSVHPPTRVRVEAFPCRSVAPPFFPPVFFARHFFHVLRRRRVRKDALGRRMRLGSAAFRWPLANSTSDS